MPHSAACPHVCSSELLEALLSLVGALSVSNAGGQVLADAGVMHALLPLLGDYR